MATVNETSVDPKTHSRRRARARMVTGSETATSSGTQLKDTDLKRRWAEVWSRVRWSRV